MVWGLNPVSSNRFFSSPKCPDRCWGPPSLVFVGYWVSFLGIKWPRCDVDHLSPSSVEV
jgi:hypothetical protein